MTILLIMISDKLELVRAYPNPFESTTIIEYTVLAHQETTLQILDQLGKEVITLVNDLKVPETYIVDFDGSDLNGGMYLLFFSLWRLSIYRETDVARMSN